MDVLLGYVNGEPVYGPSNTFDAHQPKGSGAMTLYYVCSLCGHYVLCPEEPTKCENCRASASFLESAESLEEAEEMSEEYIEDRRRSTS